MISQTTPPRQMHLTGRTNKGAVVLESHDLQGRDKIAMTLFWAAVPIYLFSFLFQLVVSQAGTRANASTAPHTNHLPHTVLEKTFGQI
jgi:hypothetical protein